MAAVTNLSIPGPAGPIPARHYRPAHADGAAAGLLPRRRVGHRRPRHPRRSVPTDLPRRPHPRVVGRLPAGARAQGARRGRGRVRGVSVGARACGELGADADRVAVGGDSAGGNLAAVVSQRPATTAHGCRRCSCCSTHVTNFVGETRSQTLFADGYLPDQARYATGSAISTWAGRRVDADRPAGVAAAGRRPVRAAARPAADRRLRPAARRGQPVRRGAAGRGRHRGPAASSVR